MLRAGQVYAEDGASERVTLFNERPAGAWRRWGVSGRASLYDEGWQGRGEDGE